nr:immunoglobulin heavy chain junction region [Mus musculus]
YARAYPFDYW